MNCRFERVVKISLHFFVTYFIGLEVFGLSELLDHDDGVEMQVSRTNVLFFTLC